LFSPAGGCRGGREGSERFFFEKKKQKTSVFGGVWRRRRQSPQGPEVFWFFFSKKNLLFFRILFAMLGCTSNRGLKFEKPDYFCGIFTGLGRRAGGGAG
jgi:hypothetical protein